MSTQTSRCPQECPRMLECYQESKNRLSWSIWAVYRRNGNCLECFVSLGTDNLGAGGRAFKSPRPDQWFSCTFFAAAKSAVVDFAAVPLPTFQQPGES